MYAARKLNRIQAAAPATALMMFFWDKAQYLVKHEFSCFALVYNIHFLERCFSANALLGRLKPPNRLFWAELIIMYLLGTGLLVAAI